MSGRVYGRMSSNAARVNVVAVFQHPDGTFTVRGTLDREQVPVVLRSAAELVEDSDEANET